MCQLNKPVRHPAMEKTVKAAIQARIILVMQRQSVSTELPVSFLITAREAMQGVHSKLKIINEKAEAGVNMLVRKSPGDGSPGADDMIDNVLTAASLAEKPAMSAAAAC